MSTTDYPFDLSELQKGQTIPAEQIEEAYGISRDDKLYAMRQMDLCTRIKAHYDARGIILTVRSVGAAVRILTDDEASEYNHKHYNNKVRRMREHHYRNAHVDMSELSGKQLRAHERNLEVEGLILQSIAKARQTVKMLRKNRERDLRLREDNATE